LKITARKYTSKKYVYLQHEQQQNQVRWGIDVDQ
jgi:hypothetical protein